MATMNFYMSAFSVVLPTVVHAAPTFKNITIEVPVGTTTQKGLLCYPTTWVSILSFYLGNYVSHAATVRSDPGAPSPAVIARILLSLFFPAGAAIQGLIRFFELAIMAKTPLGKAARSGALCTVSRSSDWEPSEGQYIAPDNLVEKEPEHDPNDPSIHQVERSGQTIHGSYSIPKNYYTIRKVKPNEPVFSLSDGQETQLSFSYSFTKGIVAVIQLALTISTLIKTQGNQIERYGYAAFGLTVAPYAVGSLTNLLSGIVTPEYPCLYLVRSNAMAEAESIAGCYFDGVVGKLGSLEQMKSEQPGIESGSANLETETGDTTGASGKGPQATTAGTSSEAPESGHLLGEQKQRGRAESLGFALGAAIASCNPKAILIAIFKIFIVKEILLTFAILWVIAAPLIIVGGLSKFKAGRSTVAERVWTMGWLAAGQFWGVFTWIFQKYYRFQSRYSAFAIGELIGLVLLATPFAVFGVGGLVEVGKMLMEFGDCSAVGG